MKWIIGLDLLPRSHGAIQWANWLSTNSRAADREALVGIHVLEEQHLAAVLRYHHLDWVVESAQESANKIVGEQGATDVVRDVHVLQGLTADRSLEAARVYHHADALIVGRQAKRDSTAMVRLGRVARRLLRSLRSPVIVVPPDLSAADVGKGAVIAMTSLTDDSVRACEFAARMAARLDRKLVVAHAVALPEDYGVQYLPTPSLERLRDDHRREGESALTKWLSEHSLRPDRTAVLAGQPVQRVVELAVAEDAPLVVCGSRLLGNFDRVLLTSVGSDLAAVAPTAVAIVPPL